MNKRVVFFFAFIFVNSVFGNEVKYGLKQLSFNEQACMKVFFDEAIRKDQAAHVIFFKNKPICLTGPALKHSDKSFRDILVLRGWQAFKKHESLFPHPQFIFSENVRESDGDYKILDIYIINKQSLISCLTSHEALFKSALGLAFDIRDFVEQLERGASLSALINDNEILRGVLLGYGLESSRAFNEIATNHSDRFAPPPTATYQCVDIKKIKGCKILPVVFMGNPESMEVKELSKTYEDELEQIAKIYGEKRMGLRMILEKLCKK